jgi:hypothetical protein
MKGYQLAAHLDACMEVMAIPNEVRVEGLMRCLCRLMVSEKLPNLTYDDVLQSGQADMAAVMKFYRAHFEARRAAA